MGDGFVGGTGGALGAVIMGILVIYLFIKIYPFYRKDIPTETRSSDSNSKCYDVSKELGVLYLDPKVEEEIWVSESDKHRVRKIIKISLIFLFVVSVSLVFYELVLVGDGCVRDGDYVACPE